jgi:RNA-directed DNA polymerase
VVSSALLNIALHGMEQAAGVRYYPTGPQAGQIVAGGPVLIRYADDLVALCHSRQEALEVKARLASWLAPRGLAFSEDKTRVVTLSEGFDFPGFNVRRYGNKLLIKPSKAAVRRIRERLRTELRSLRGTNAPTVIKKLNPIIRGWAAYYRTQVSSEAFGALDGYLWQLTFKWARFSHANKPTRWVVARYYARFNKTRRDRWVFGDRKSGAYMHKFAWTNIVRHQMVKGGASPDDPALAEYWAERRRKTPLPINKTSRWLLKAQDGRCSICRNALLPDDHRPQTPREWELWLATTRKTITKSPCGRTTRRTSTNPVSYTSTAATAAARRFCPPTSLWGLLEPDARKRARPGSEGGRAQQCARPTRPFRTCHTSLGCGHNEAQAEAPLDKRNAATARAGSPYLLRAVA